MVARAKFSQKIKSQVIDDLVSGRLNLKEVMTKYKILSKQTVVRWLKEYIASSAASPKSKKRED